MWLTPQAKKGRICIMSIYAVCSIGTKQYKVVPGIPFLVDRQDQKKIEVDVFLLADEKGIKLGKPYMAEKISLQVQEDVSGSKIKVAKFHAKANYRRQTGLRPKYSKVIWPVKN